MSDPRVFVVQNQHRWDRATSKFVPKYDFGAAQEYGRLVYLLSPTAAPFNPDPILEELQTKLADFNSKDHLLLVGNPILIGFATAIAAHANRGNISLLQWSGRDERYLAVTARSLFT